MKNKSGLFKLKFIFLNIKARIKSTRINITGIETNKIRYL